MKVSNKPTVHILVKANTNSEWDSCEFAIIHLSEQWKKQQANRLEWVAPLQGKPHFCSMNFYDTAVDFYRTDEDDEPNVEQLLGDEDKEWVFVELSEDEQEKFTIPENKLDYYRLVLYSNGTAYYTAYGKHTNEEFWTEEFNLNAFCFPDNTETELEKLCRERFQHLTNAQLVARVNRLPDFGWDDEGVELQRRQKTSKGAFKYGFRGNTMVILKNENQ